MSPALQDAAFAHLLLAFKASAGQAPAERWLHLEAAHVLGQNRLGLHWRSHWHMLRHALEQRDAREAAGQLLRLGLTPLGHLLRRLPLGNTGRASVPALQPMEPGPAVRARMAAALAAVAGPGNPIQVKKPPNSYPV